MHGAEGHRAPTRCAWKNASTVRIEPLVESGAVKLRGVDADFGYGLRKRLPARDQEGEVPSVADDMGFMPSGEGAAISEIECFNFVTLGVEVDHVARLPGLGVA